jgi:hypothetical protein
MQQKTPIDLALTKADGGRPTSRVNPMSPQGLSKCKPDANKKAKPKLRNVF